MNAPAVEPVAVGHDFVSKAGISWRQFDTWTRAGLLRPIGSPSPGSGRQREFPYEELVIARCIRDILDAGFTLAKAAELARLGPGEYQLTDRVHLQIAPQPPGALPEHSQEHGR